MLIISIGRNSNNQIVIPNNDNSVSGNHGEIKILNNGSIYYCDISKNGTVVNGKIIKNSECIVQRGTPIVFPDSSVLDWKQVPFPSTLTNVQTEITIGKNSDNKIHIHDDKISRYHATLKLTSDGKYYLFDQSTNGSLVNGKKIPKYTDYLVKRNDKIFFSNSHLLDWKKVPRASSKPVFFIVTITVLLLGLCSFFIYKNFKAVNVSIKYSNSVCLVYNSYYLAYLNGDDTLYYIGNNKEIRTIFDLKRNVFYYVSKNGVSYEANKQMSDLIPIKISGSGFFISETGKIVTNKHVASPWESDLVSDKEILQKIIGNINTILGGEPNYNPRIIGISNKVGIFLNESLIDKSEPLKNLIECNFIKSSPEKEIDLALIQTKNKSLPLNTNYIHNSDIISDKSEIKVDDEITIIGFPLGFKFAQKNSENKIKSTSNHGRVSKLSDKYEIQYDAGTTHGASGSPVFNKEGKLIAVNYAAVEIREGFNFGIIATHIKNLLSE